MLLPILWSTKVEILEVIHITCVLYYKSSESPKNLNISLFLFLSLSLLVMFCDGRMAMHTNMYLQQRGESELLYAAVLTLLTPLPKHCMIGMFL